MSGIGLIGAAAVDRTGGDIDAGAEGVDVGLVGDVANRARHGPGPEGGALRAIQDLDALDVVEVQIRLRAPIAHRYVIDEEAGG